MLHPAIIASRKGRIHGVCLVTTEPIRAGELIWRITEPMYNWSEVESWDEEKREAYDWYGFQCGEDQFSLPVGLSREMNHSCDPNTWWSGSTRLVARRDIGAGEEITYDYATTEVDHDFELNCDCGSARCRGRVTHRDYLDPAWQAQYGPNLPPHMLAAIRTDRGAEEISKVSEPIDAQIRRLHLGVRDLSASVEALSPEAFISALGNWSPRDIVAHLIGWNRYIVRGCRQLMQGETPFYDLDPGEDYSKVNAHLVAKYSATNRSELLAELEESAAELERFVRTVSVDDWQRDSGVRHLGEVLTVGGTVSELIDDYFHHIGQIQ